MDWRRPGFTQDDRHPVTCLSWDDATAYTQWLTQRTGVTYRLLTEAQWEYIARAGTASSRFWGDDPNEACRFANVGDRAFTVPLGQPVLHDCDDGVGNMTAPVGRYEANPFGIHDLMGNVWEWVQDCFHDSYRNAPRDGRAWLEAGGGNCKRRMYRGGAWNDSPATVRSANRANTLGSTAVLDAGVRVQREF